MFSIIIPTFNNLDYLKLCIKSIRQNSKYTHQIIPHVNIGEDGTCDFLRDENIDFTFTKYNSGICEGMNTASKKSKFKYILYSHDDFYFCPGWDEVLKNEVEAIGHNNFYFSGVMMNNGPIRFNAGSDIKSFDENKVLNEYQNYNHYDFQGSTWAPHLLHRELWEKVGGFSEEFFPGTGSDPDLNMKLWKEGVRVFKGVNNCKVYHFGSIILRKKINSIKKNNYGSSGAKIFLMKWGITIKFFKKFYLKSNTRYEYPLSDPSINFNYLFNLFLCKINLLYIKLFYSKS